MLQSMHAPLELIGQPREQRSLIPILEQVKLRDDVVTLLARLYHLHKTRVPAVLPELHRLRIHPRGKEGVVPDVAPYLPLLVERRSRAKYRIRRRDHLAHILDRLSFGI